MFEVTLKDLRSAGACVEGYNKVVSALKGIPFDEERETYIRYAHKKPISILSIIETNGLDDALWALRCVKDHDHDMRLYAVWCARQVEHLNTDPRVKNCNDVAERFANGQATEDELAAACAAARDAAWAAASAAAWDAARDAAWAAVCAAESAAAWDAARDAAWAAVCAAERDAARDAARDAQKKMLIDMCNGVAPWQTKE